MYRLLSTFVLFLLILQTSASAQLIKSWNFNDPGNPLMSWTTESLYDNGGNAPGFATWEYTSDGTAPGAYWASRGRINSNSKGGAITFNSDRLATETDAGVDHSGQITSPSINCPSCSEIYLKFYNYYRNYESETYVDILSLDGGGNVVNTESIQVNTTINPNVETGKRDYTLLYINDFTQTTDFQIRFRFAGSYYFWIIDDVEVWEGKPYDESFPEYLGDSLVTYNTTYKTDSLGGAYKVRELEANGRYNFYEEMVVEFDPSVPLATREAKRIEYGATLLDSCVCNTLELWELNDNIVVSDGSLTADGGSTGAEERVAKGNADNDINGAGLNHFVFDELRTLESDTLPALVDGFLGGVTNPDLKIAILDTGMDYYHPNLQDNVYYFGDEWPANEVDMDNSCYADDPLGWNFINDNNNPRDDHSHGTHIAGIIHQNLSSSSCNYGLLSVKTHNNEGVGTIYTSTCGLYYALKKDANLINGSWGYYGEANRVLSNALDTAGTQEVLFLSSAGNDTVSLDTRAHYPGSFGLDNVMTIAALDSTSRLSAYANYSPSVVDLGAPGDNINSYLPGGISGTKDGSSMAAPAVAAAAGTAYCSGYQTVTSMKSQILNCAISDQALVPFIQGGLILNLNGACLVPITALVDNPSFKVFPNPVEDQLFLQLDKLEVTNLNLRIYDVLGKMYYEVALPNLQNGISKNIDVKHLPSGMYILHLEGEEVNQSIKLMIK